MKYYIQYCRGTNEGQAIYVMNKDEGIGNRLFGPKCWGFIKTIKEWKLHLSEIEYTIKVLQKIKRQLKKEAKE